MKRLLLPFTALVGATAVTIYTSVMALSDTTWLSGVVFAALALAVSIISLRLAWQRRGLGDDLRQMHKELREQIRNSGHQQSASRAPVRPAQARAQRVSQEVTR